MKRAVLADLCADLAGLAQAVADGLRYGVGGFKLRPCALGVPDGSIDLRLVPEIESDGAVYLLKSKKL